MALTDHNLPSGRLKNYNDEVNEAMFQAVVRPCEIIFCFPVIENSDFHEVA
jgi:hypothetical protein